MRGEQGAGDLWEDPEDLTDLTSAKAVVSRMMGKAGVTPGQLEVAEVHDCFAVTELMMYEAIGLAEPGQGAELFRSGATRLDGKIPVNTGGGLLSYGHPVGATGVKQVRNVILKKAYACSASACAWSWAYDSLRPSDAGTDVVLLWRCLSKRIRR
jgi:acetyl-CoA acyltransferase